jgi:hypothetical protein
LADLELCKNQLSEYDDELTDEYNKKSIILSEKEGK